MGTTKRETCARMKFKRNSVFDAIFLSDIHFLVDSKKIKKDHKELQQTLDFFIKKNIYFENIFLVGDIVENWYISALRYMRKHKNSKKKLIHFFDFFDKIATNDAQKIFIIGNHDTTRYNQKLNKRLENFLVRRNWQIMERFENHDMVIAHGHQGQYGKIRWFFNILLLRFLYNIPKLWQVLEYVYGKYLDFDKNLSIEKMIQYYSRLTKKIKQNNKILIMGHTHRFTCLEQLRVINTGDWLESHTLVVRKKKTLYGLKYLGKIDNKVSFRKEFELKIHKRK